MIANRRSVHDLRARIAKNFCSETLAIVADFDSPVRCYFPSCFVRLDIPGDPMFSSLLTKPANCVAMLLFIAGCVLPSSTWAQELPEDGKATIAFDFQVARMMEEADGIGIDTNPLMQLPLQNIEGVSLGSLERVYGAVNLPASTQDFMVFDPQAEPPVDAFVRIRFKTVEGAEQLWEHLSKTGEEVEIDGARFLVENSNSPNSSMAQKTDSREIEVGTGGFLKRKDRKVRTALLIEAFNAAPDAAARIAIDMQGNSELIKEVMEMARDQAPPMAAPFIGLLDNAKYLIASTDLKNKNLMTLAIQAVDESNAEELKEGLNSLLEIGKMTAAQQLSDPPPGMLETATMMQNLINGIRAEQDGAVVKVAVDADEKLIRAMGEWVAQAQQQAKKVQRMNNVRQMMLAALNYESVHRQFPYQALENQSNELSWRVRVLPYLEENAMFSQMDLSKGPGEEPNAQFADQMPEVYGEDGKLAKVVWVQSKADRFARITDGSSNTIALIETDKGFPWLENSSMTQAAILEMVEGMPKGKQFIVAMYDGSVRTMDSSIDKETLRKLLDPQDGEEVDWDW